MHGSNRNLSNSESSVNSACYARTASQGHGPVRSSSHRPKSTDQNQINQSILTQLNTFSDRLIKIENSTLMGKKGARDAQNKSKVSQAHWGGPSGNCVSQSVRPSVSVTSKSIPLPASLRQDVRVQQEVQARLGEFADNTHVCN